jgi:amino acid transporter
VVAGTTPWTAAGEQIKARGAFTVVDLASQFIPQGILSIMPALILIAIASTIYPLLLAYSRDFMAAGRDQLLPAAVGRINRRYGTPVGGLTLLLIFSLALFALILILAPALELPLQTAVDLFAAISVSGLLAFEILLSIAALRLAGKFPAMERQSGFRLSRPVLWIVAIGGIVSAVAFLALLGMDEPLILESLAVLVIPFVVYYFIRNAFVRRRNISLKANTATWPSDVTVE